MDKATTIDRLLKTPLFAGLNQEHMDLVYSCGKLSALDKGMVVINEGQTDHHLFVILDGEMDIMLPKINDEFERISEVKLGAKKKGDCVGEYTFIDGRPASASVVACDKSTIFILDNDKFKNILDTNDSLAKAIYFNMLKVLAGNIRLHDESSDTFILT